MIFYIYITCYRNIKFVKYSSSYAKSQPLHDKYNYLTNMYKNIYNIKDSYNTLI
jgi:hypothetical protein